MLHNGSKCNNKKPMSGGIVSKNFKILVSSGCSFSAGDNKWNHFTAEQLNLLHANYGAVAAGNAYISRSIIYGVDKALETYDNSDILVGIMWSGSSRYDNYHSDLSRYKFKPYYNFIKDDTGGFVRMTHDNPDWYTAPFFKLYHDFIGSYIYTLENFLKTQWFLENKKIEYFMTFYAQDVLPDDKDKNHPSLQHLIKMINWDKFLPIDNCFEWCKKSNIPGNVPDESIRLLCEKSTNLLLNSRATHPSTEQQRGFAEQVVVPYIKQNILN